MAKFFKAVPLLLVIALWSSLVLVNFRPGSWLTGWDNLHSEFNFVLNVKRSLSAVWQEYQGVGLVGGMAHAADLPRLLILWPVSLVVPGQYLRYIWTFAMLLLGPLGVYFCFKERLAGFAASIFYLLNLATVQYFFLPYESFVSFYGFLPWLIFLSLNYLREGGKKNLLVFMLVSFFATPAFYVQTLFVVYVLILSLVLVDSLLRERKFSRAFALVAAIFIINSYWLLPVSYFTLTNPQVLYKSHINSIGTPETELMNEARGNFSDIALLKGYWLDYYDLGKDGQFDYLYSDWISHLNNPTVVKAGIALFAISVSGFFLAFFDKKSPLRFTGIPLLFLTYLMLAGQNPLGRFPIFAEMFRNSFTKWSVAAAFIYSLGLGSFVLFLDKFLKSYFKAIIVLSVGIALSLSIYITGPAFFGKLISDRVRIDIPKEYFEVFDYFKNKPRDARIATLPIQSFWGWVFTDWGYRGGGFLWYAIEQPILDRAFDVWSKNNESFYNQANFALYSGNPELFRKTLEKYQVSYLLLDKNAVNPDNVGDTNFIDKTESFLAQIPEISEEKKVGSLVVYKTNLMPTNSFLSSPNNFISINANLDYAQSDPIFMNYGNYIFDKNAPGFPFVNLDKRAGVKVEFEGDEIMIAKEDKQIVLNVPQTDRTIETFSADRGLSEAKNCDLKEKGNVSKETRAGFTYKAENGGIECDFLNYGNVAYDKGYILHIAGENKEGRGLKIYLQNWQTRKIEMQELLPTGKFDESFFMLPQNYSGSGYTLNLETRSFGRVASENVLEEVEIIPFDYNFLSQVYQDPFKDQVLQGVYSVKNKLKVKDVRKIGPFLYIVDAEGSGLLQLGQGYEPGWRAYPSRNFQLNLPDFRQELKHVKVNSWANGWFVEPTVVSHQPSAISNSETDSREPRADSRILIVFWPQILEFVGFGLAITGFLTICLLPSPRLGSDPEQGNDS